MPSISTSVRILIIKFLAQPDLDLHGTATPASLWRRFQGLGSIVFAADIARLCNCLVFRPTYVSVYALYIFLSAGYFSSWHRMGQNTGASKRFAEDTFNLFLTKLPRCDHDEMFHLPRHVTVPRLRQLQYFQRAGDCNIMGRKGGYN